MYDDDESFSTKDFINLLLKRIEELSKAIGARSEYSAELVATIERDRDRAIRENTFLMDKNGELERTVAALAKLKNVSPEKITKRTRKSANGPVNGIASGTREL